MRRLTKLLPRSSYTYKRLTDDSSSSASGEVPASPRNERVEAPKLPPSEGVGLSKGPTPAGKRRHNARTPERRTLYRKPRTRLPKAEPLFAVLKTSSERAQGLLDHHPALVEAIDSATALWVCNEDGQSRLSMDARTAYAVFTSLVADSPSLACRFLARLHSGSLADMLLIPEAKTGHARAIQVRTLLEKRADRLEKLADRRDPSTAISTASQRHLHSVHEAIGAMAREYVRFSLNSKAPIGLDRLLDACPLAALPEVLKTIEAVDSNPDPLRGSTSTIRQWCESDERFATALADAKHRLRNAMN